MQKGQHSHRFTRKLMNKIGKNIENIMNTPPPAPPAPPVAAMGAVWVNPKDIQKPTGAKVIHVYPGGLTEEDCERW